MNHVDRLHSQVRILDLRGKPVGCGFIRGDRHVLTCTHVIQPHLLAGRKIECVFRGAQDLRARLRVVSAYHPVDDEEPEQALLRDIALLELEDGSTFPPEYKVVSSRLEQLESHMDFHGVGIKQGFLEGIQIAGKTGEYLESNRVFVASWHNDQAVKPGCSGAPVFNTDKGLLGMVAEVQQSAMGLIIPIQVLREVWPIRGTAGSARPHAGLGSE